MSFCYIKPQYGDLLKIKASRAEVDERAHLKLFDELGNPRGDFELSKIESWWIDESDTPS